MKASIDEIVERIAREQKISREEVLREMQTAIDAGLNDPSPAVQAEWKKAPHAGEKPTPQELILDLAQKLKSAG